MMLSKGCAAACLIVAVGAFERSVETASRHILLDLAVPRFGHELNAISFPPVAAAFSPGRMKAR